MYDLGRLYLITDDKLDFKELYKKCETALEAGVKLLQYRRKEGTFRERFYEASRLMELCSRYGCKLIINDRVDLALAVDAHGVHLGQDDMDPLTARRILGKDKIIGVTAKTREQALRAFNDGADCLGVGALFPSTTKKDALGISLDTLREIKRAVPIAIYGIGGITEENLNADILDNVDGIAVVSAILSKENVAEVVLKFNKLLNS